MASPHSVEHSRIAALLFGGGNLFSALLVMFAAFLSVREFEPWLHGFALLLAGTSFVAGVALMVGRPWARSIARVAATALLVVGCVFVLLLVSSIAFLYSVAGPVGSGGTLVFGLVVALAVPYVVVLPLAQLVWLGRRSTPGDAK